jgi:hypothetical protein
MASVVAHAVASVVPSKVKAKAKAKANPATSRAHWGEQSNNFKRVHGFLQAFSTALYISELHSIGHSSET